MKDVLVIGGGIAGIQASLDMADAGFIVHLVEKEPTIGGHMAQTDKVFPTLDCSSCILTPKMVSVGQHPNIRLYTLSEVTKIEGQAGDFTVEILRHPRYVDESACTGCGACAEACVMKGRIKNAFDMGIGKRGAIYIAFPQAVPLKYAIDPEACLTLSRGKCKKGPPCKLACAADAIHFDDTEKKESIRVGAIVVATGYDPFDPALKPEYGYGKYPEVLTALELERLCSASGPTLGEIIVNGKKPSKVFFIQCVGSRDHTVGNLYCSRVCCMFTAKHAHMVKDKFPDAKVTVTYIDIRAFGKGYEEFYERVQKEGIIYRRGVVSEVFKKGDKLYVRGEDTFLGETYEEEADMVVLATGLVQREGLDVIKRLGIKTGEDRFFTGPSPLDPVETGVPGVFLAGCCVGPKDIPDTVVQASGAASRAMAVLAKAGSSPKEAAA